MTTLTILVTHDGASPDSWFASVSDNDGTVATLRGPSTYDVLLEAAPIIDRHVAARVRAVPA